MECLERLALGPTDEQIDRYLRTDSFVAGQMDKKNDDNDAQELIAFMRRTIREDYARAIDLLRSLEVA